jgi:peptidylprolyl isomerase
VLGKVGDIEITSTDVREMIAGLDAEQQAALAKDPEALGQYVRALLVQRLVLKQALDQKWDQEPAVISKLVRAREAALTESFLQNASVSNASYPSAEELSAAYEVAKSKLIIPRSYKLAQIYIAKDKAKMESISKQIKAKGADFATIARSSSEESTSAAKGGEIGWLTEDQIQPEIREKILTLAPGKVGEPVSLQDGWHLIKVLEIREPRTPALDEIRDNLVTQLRKDRSRSLRQEYLATLLKDHPLAINEIELTKLVEKP